MPIPTSAPEIVMFAINSAISIGSSLRQGYINDLRSKELTLPLPEVDLTVSLDQITDFYTKRPNLTRNLPKLQRLVADEPNSRFSEEQEQQYREYFHTSYMQVYPPKGTGMQEDALVNLVSFRQWFNEEDEPITGLRLVVGSLVEVGVDYFQQIPGALNPDSKYASALTGVLESLDGIDLKSREGQKGALKLVGPQLFTSAIEAVSELAPSLISDPKFKAAVQEACTGITNDLCTRLESLALLPDEEFTVQQWGKTVFQSMVRHTAPALVSQIAPDTEEAKFLQGAGVSLMNTIIDQDFEGLSLKEIITGPALDSLIKTGLEGIAAHPQWVTKHDILGKVLSDVATAASTSDFERKNLIPELARLALQQTAANFNLLMAVDEDNPQQVIVVAVQELLGALSQPVEGGNWKPTLSNKQVLGLADSLFIQVAENPQWITQKIGENSLLGEVLTISMQSMKAIPAEKRLSGNALQAVLQSSVQAVAVNRLLLQKLPLVNGETPPALGYALEAAFAYIYGDAEGASNQWAFAKNEAISDVIGKLLSSIAQQPVSVSFIDEQLSLAFGGVENQLINGFLNSLNGLNLDNGIHNALCQQMAPALLQEAVTTVEAIAPELIKDPAFQGILTHASREMATALSGRLSGMAAGTAQESWKVWGNSLSRSLTKELSLMTLSASIDMFGASEAESKIIERVGTSILATAFDSQMQLKDVLRGENLDKLVKTALHTASEYPEVFGESEVLKQVLGEVAASVAATGIQRPNIVPELMRLTLEKAQGQLHLIYQPQTGAGNILATAIQQTLTILVTPTAQGQWKPQLNQQQLLGITSVVINEVANHPSWVLDKIGEASLLQETLSQSLQAVGKMSTPELFSQDSLKALLNQSIKSVAMRQQLLDKLPGGDSTQYQTILSYSIDSLLGYVFNESDVQIKWASTKTQVLNVLIEHVLNKAAIGPAETGTVDNVLEKLKEQMAKFRDNEAFDSVLFLRELLLG